MKYELLKALRLKSTFSYDYTTTKGVDWSDPRNSNGDDINGGMSQRYYERKKMVWANQLTYRFDGNGNLVYMEYLSDTNGHEYKSYIEIYEDTAEEIDAKIQSSIQNLYVSSFSWKDAKAKYMSDEFNHRDSGFVNNDMVSIDNPVDAARRALKEYPKLGDYLSLDIAHDDESHMWRVTIKSYHDYQATDEYRDIYLDDNGVTQLLVYEGPIEYDQTRK